ncbi:tRNA (guanine(37)-N1)-methyltransferase [Galleria mellonella]|uniref:tRNA (guanine(37)-N1)-methyltransferase n=1 Tax=Galleria mellonella TaxID=7137 RepID=A0A6J1WXV9_GALME|nr:tRNA (guanine(37)-N1)-methyltransferase [Galleria mellonella]
MSTLKNFSLSPVEVRGMKVLNREKFLRNIEVSILKVAEEKLSKVTQHCKHYFLKLENFKPVQDFDLEGEYRKCIYLNPEIVSQWKDISEHVRETLITHGIDEANFVTKLVQLSYDNWRYDTIFKAVLPEDEEIVSGFSQIGHIIHLNLRDHLLEYRQLIGQVLVDKIKTCRTVVNKSNIIDNTYRNFSMEVIAGDEDFFVTVKENNCIFQFDFSKVYWNPRLCKEHERIITLLKPSDVLFDVFCGVGPFSIPAAKRKCRVYSNDLNPDSFKWLNHNAKNNKLNLSLFKSYNQDGKDFICDVFKEYLIECCRNNEIREVKIHVTMNLPAMAVEFLKYFRGLIEDKQYMDKFNCEIIVYVYCFAMGDDPVNIAKCMVNDNMGCDMSSYIVDVFDVRNVSPKKEMMRVTFKLTKEVLFDVNNYEPPAKKLCVND